jgi:tRNA (cytidine/uridine-2'-O-)-methyltransferase
MFNIVLYQPEIPPNTGNIIRLCVNSGCQLHLIKPLGFSLNEKHLKRANLDYAMAQPPSQYDSFEEYQKNAVSTLFLCTTKAKTIYSEVRFKPGDSFVFGPETRGLPAEILDSYPDAQKIIIPMQANARSLNLANSVAIVVYEAWRQHNFKR